MSRTKKIICAVALCLLLFLLYTAASKKSVPQSLEEATQQVRDKMQQSQFTELPQSPELKEAINQQRAADQEYTDWKDNNHEQFPWINKLPVGNEKYFVYFDLEKKAFLGRLYPSTGDNVEQLRTEAISKLKEKQIPADSYPIEWTVFPQ